MGQWSHADLSQIANAPPCGTGGFDFPRPVGCVRSDRTNAVLFTGHDDRHVHQLHLSGNRWVHTDLSLLTNATDFAIRAETSPMACVRPDKVFSVVYTGRDGHIHALQIGVFPSHVDLSDVAGAPKAMPIGPPTHFVRGDGVTVVVYTGFGGENTSVHQLAFTAGSWVHSNLSELTQSPPIHSRIKTAGYVRANQTTSVIYVAGAGIKELALPLNGNWTSTDLFSSVQAPRPHPLPLRWPMGFVRADGTASVLYANQDEFIHELAFVAGKWRATALSEAANAPKLSQGGPSPMGYIRGDGVTAVVYWGEDNHIHELTLVEGHWLHSDLSLAAGTSTGGYPFGYVRSDGVSSIVYSGTDRHIHELALLPE